MGNTLKRVAVTGIGMISGLGHNVDETWRNALEGKSGISTIQSIPVDDLAVKFAGEVKNFTISTDLLEPKKLLATTNSSITRFMQPKKH